MEHLREAIPFPRMIYRNTPIVMNMQLILFMILAFVAAVSSVAMITRPMR